NVGTSNSITVKLKDARSKHEATMNFAEELLDELIDILGDEINISNARTKDVDSQSPKIIDTDIILREQRDLTNKIQNAKGTLDITISSMSEDQYS
ncbi:MAG: hypothetical protein GWN56_03295, partial [Nitrosopumilaceae archaeon]|nr:hypothetical protein [Nitrosopumilaceae archaeon]